MKDISAVAKKIKLIIADVDGTLTDGGIYLTENGDEFKKFNAKDGMGVKLLMKKGFQVGIISASHARKLVLARAEMLGITLCYIGNEPKLSILEKWTEELGVGLDEIAFIGDDVNDLEIMKKVGLAFCPQDSAEEIKNISDVILSENGGRGCFREMADKYFLKLST
jgi:3-deoxy-D-manno-octulosonate 8-phosphate phosphatase (KDO 8-P phosphatase)